MPIWLNDLVWVIALVVGFAVCLTAADVALQALLRWERRQCEEGVRR